MTQDFHPDFIERYSPLFSKEEFATFLKYCKLPLRKAIRINTSRITAGDFEIIASNNNWKLKAIEYIPNAYFIEWENKEALWNSLAYFSGLFYIQETSSMIPPLVLNPQKWDIVLDVSAAPWSKTTQMANLMQWKWFIMANDIVNSRLKALKTNINYQWIINAWVSQLDGRDFWRYFEETFDKILLDAPCSGEGTMRKEKINWSFEVIEELAQLQKRLISSALQALKVGGELVYSTCTMTPEEDECIIDYVKNTYWENIEVLDWKLHWLTYTAGITSWQWKDLHNDCSKWQKIWPHINNTEWFFIAKFKKKSSIKGDKVSVYYPRKKTENIIKWKELKIIFSILEKRFWIDKSLFLDYTIVKKNKNYTIRTKESNQFSALPNIHNLWIPFWEDTKNGFLLNFYSGQVFGKYASKNKITLSIEQSNRFKKWLDIIIDDWQQKNCQEWQIILQYHDIILWTSLLQKWWKIKNQVPRENVKK